MLARVAVLVRPVILFPNTAFPVTLSLFNVLSFETVKLVKLPSSIVRVPDRTPLISTSPKVAFCSKVLVPLIVVTPLTVRSCTSTSPIVAVLVGSISRLPSNLERPDTVILSAATAFKVEVPALCVRLPAKVTGAAKDAEPLTTTVSVLALPRTVFPVDARFVNVALPEAVISAKAAVPVTVSWVNVASAKVTVPSTVTFCLKTASPLTRSAFSNVLSPNTPRSVFIEYM